jgi:hypothetical protein
MGSLILRRPDWGEMAEKTVRIFSLAEANELVPLVADLTAQVVHELESIRGSFRTEPGEVPETMPDSVLQQVEQVLADWSSRVVELGALPKGYFTVDFQSLDPELLYCWTFGEEKIDYVHKVWENFTHRQPLRAGPAAGGDTPKWVN